jgi:NAD(P)-dependent dehydrogenase (short-subunit alcohol dehydrogenase family)
MEAAHGTAGPRLSGKVAIVTGAGSRSDGIGTGRAAALTFARHGANVLAVDLDLEAAQSTVKMADPGAGHIEAFRADVTSPADCDAMVDTAVRRWGRLDILDNNVGIEGPGTVTDADWTDWDRVMAVNVSSVAKASAAAIPRMTAGGSIINIASIAAFRPHAITPYSTSKGAVIALTQSMALDHAPDVRVNCIAPGPIYTPMVAAGMTEELRERRRRAAPLATEGNAWDIAHAALFLASDDARWITGVVLPVDGGVSLQSPAR